MADEDKQPAPVAAAAPPSQKNPLVAVLLLVNGIVLCAVAYFQYSFHKKEMNKPTVQDIVKTELELQAPEKNSKEAKVVDKEKEGSLFPLDQFTVNLAQGDGPRRFIRLNLVLKLGKESKEDEFNARKPQIRDTIISILNTKRPEDLLKVEGKSFLKEEIKSTVNSFLIDGSITDIYYVGFQIN